MSLDHDYLGMDVFSNDGNRLGHVRDVFSDPEMKYEYLVIDRPKAKDCVLLASLAESRDGHLVLPYQKGFLDDAPVVDTSERRLDYHDWRALDDYYGVRAA